MPGIYGDEDVAVRGRRHSFRDPFLLDAPGIDVNHNTVAAAILPRGHAEAGGGRGGMQIKHHAQHVARVTAVTHPAHNPRAPIGKRGADSRGIKVQDNPRLVVQHLELVAAGLIEFKDHARLRVVLGHADAVYARGCGVQGAGHKPGNERKEEAVGGHACCLVGFPRWRV